MVISVSKTMLPLVMFALMFMVLSCAPNLSERIRQYVTTYNTHDVEKIMSFYADDIRFEDVGVWVKAGKQEVRKITEWDAATHIVMKISNVTVQGDTVTFSLVETNDWLKLAGIGEALYEPSRVVFRNGKIAVIEAKLSEETMKIWMPAWNAIIAWAKANSKEKLAEAMPEGKFVFGADYAHKWIDLLKEWREAAGKTE